MWVCGVKMQIYGEVLLDALVDTLKIVPLLFAVYYLIELFEFKCAHKMHDNKFLKGKAGPVFGSLLGCVPQCGFSVISTDMFTDGYMSIGALIAVYIATSDEALPLMIANPDKILWLSLLIGIKILYGIVIGYFAGVLHKMIFKNRKVVVEGGEHVSVHGGCCHHDVESKSFDWLHPLLHCLKISGFILAVNILFGFITQIWIGKDALTSFLSSSKYLQPLFAIIIGLIPNCASSVVLTELFLVGGLEFGALVAGLCVNAGLGLVVLLKQNNNIKENLFIFGVLIASGLIVGYGLILIL